MAKEYRERERERERRGNKGKRGARREDEKETFCTEEDEDKEEGRGQRAGGARERRGAAQQPLKIIEFLLQVLHKHARSTRRPTAVPFTLKNSGQLEMRFTM